MRFFSVVLSVITACAVAIFAPEMPSINRAMNNNQSVLEKTQHDESDQRPDLADNQHRLASIPVRQPP